jgi:hypothetical protein
VPVWYVDGVDDYARWSTLSTGLAALPSAAWTFAILLKREVTGVKAIFELANSADASRLYMWHGTNEWGVTVGVNEDFGTTATAILSDLADTYIMVFTKASGTSAMRIHRRNVSTSVTARENTTTVANGTAMGVDGYLYVGADRFASWGFEGWMGLFGAWDVNMSDAQTDELWATNRTSDWYNSSAAQPVFLSELTTLAAPDITGNSGIDSNFNGTLDYAETLEGWIFDGDTPPPPTPGGYQQVTLVGPRRG